MIRLIITKHRTLFVILFLLSALLSCNFPLPGNADGPELSGQIPGDEFPEAGDWQLTVNRLGELQDELEIPNHLLEPGAVKSEKDFNPNEYFSILKHLRMDEGYELDYVYQYELLGGKPLLYARKVKKKPYRTAEDYAQQFPEASPDDFLARVHSDGSAKGYFEFIVLKIMAGQFYLWWNANYDDARVVVERQTLENLLGSKNQYGEELPLEVRQEAGSLDPTPVVEIQAKTVQVQLLFFTNWGGFIRKSYTLRRDFPHEILKEREQVLVPFHSEVAY